MSTPVGVIKKFVKTLVETKKTGTDAADEAFKAVSAGNYTAFKAEFKAAQKGYSSQDFCEQVCGIRINNKDIGAITGSDAGGKTTKTAESIVPESAKAVKLTDAEYNSFTKNGLTVNVEYEEVTNKEAGANFNYDSETYLEKQKLVVRALYNWWIPEALDLIDKSLGINFTDGRANVTTMNIKFDNNGSKNTQAVELDFDYDMGLASEITLEINSDLLYNITEKDVNGTLPNDCHVSSDFHSWTYNYTNYLDRLILQGMAEVALAANVPYADKLPDPVVGGLCAIVGGFDDVTTTYTSFTSGSGRNVVGGYAELRYLAKNYSDGMPDGVSYNANKTVLTLSTDFDEDTLDLADFASTVKNVKASALKKGITIIGNAKDNSIVGGSGNDSILGGTGKDTLSGGKGDDTLKGGNGNDVFIYTAGNDIIEDYMTGDKISLGGAISKATLSGDDVVFTIGKGTLTVKDGANKKLSMINSKGKTFETLVSGATTLTINNKTKSPVKLDSDVGTADASKRTKAVKIVGNKLDNVILGGSKNDILYGESGNDSIQGNKGDDKIYGGFGNDTLEGGEGKDKLLGGAGADNIYGGAGDDCIIGGAGNDSLWGNAGADIFIYNTGEGKDIIFGFDDKDTLNLDSIDFTATYKDKAVTLTFEEGSVTFKDFTAKTFHINDETYQIKSNKFVEKS